MPQPQRFTVFVVLGVAFFSSLLTLGVLSTREHEYFNLVTETPLVDLVSDSHRTPRPLLGPPTTSFRDNLRDDTLYLTSIFDTGWTNEVMVHGNMLYLALMTQRVPILPPFAPSHIGEDAPRAPFSEVFDLPRLSAALHMSILEWKDVKAENSTADDPLGCWSVWETIHEQDGVHMPRHSWLADVLYVDMSYTPVPDWARTAHPDHTTFARLARLAYPETRAQSLGDPHPSKRLGLKLPPDDHLLCFDVLYFASNDQPWEYDHESSPVWHVVMKHARFTPRLEDIANQYLRTMFGLSANAPIPLFIAIHARHGDFKGQCGDVDINHCFTPLAVWKKHVDTLREELQQKKGVDVVHVVISSDEKDEGWWAEVADLGWYHVDHNEMRTEETYGRWYPVFIDVAIQGASKGFLGTSGSTLSLLSMRRAQDWNDGLGKMVIWNRFGEHPEAVEA